MSAHWYINATAVTAMPRPKTIHDFFGFPPELFDVRYDAPGLPELAEEVSDVVTPTWVGSDVDSWGIDHGTWSVLVHAFPMADIPVVQLAINATKPMDYHLELGAKLAPLRDAGVLILGSAGMEPCRQHDGFDWARRFDDAAKELILDDPAKAPQLAGHRDFGTSVPTPDHFIPMLYLAGLAGAGSGATDVLVDGYAYGSLSMTSYLLDGDPPPPAPQTPDADAEDRGLPDLDPEQTNL